MKNRRRIDINVLKKLKNLRWLHQYYDKHFTSKIIQYECNEEHDFQDD